MGFEGLGELAAFIFGCIAVVVLISFLVGGFILRRFFKKWSVILPLVYCFLVLLGMIVFFGVDLGAGPIWVFVLMAVGLPFTLLALVAPGHEISSHIGTLLVVITGTLQYFLLGWILMWLEKNLKKCSHQNSFAGCGRRVLFFGLALFACRLVYFCTTHVLLSFHRA